MSLTTCLKKSAAVLDAETRREIMSRAAEFRQQGKSASEAGLAAVDAMLKETRERLIKIDPENAGQYAPESSESATGAKIDDAGEKIGGARKDRWAERGLDVSDLDAMAEGEGAELATKANVWKPDYQAIAAQSEPVTAAMVKVVYDSLAAKPRQNTPQGRRDYVRAMQAVRKVYGAVQTVQEAKDAYRALREELGIPAVRLGLSELSEAHKEARRVLFSVYKGRSDPFVFGYNELARAKKLVQDGFPGAVEPWTRRFVIREFSGAGVTEAGMRMYLLDSAAAGTPLTEAQIRASHFEVRDKAGRPLAYLPTKADAEQAARALYEATKGNGDEKQEPTRPHLDDIKREGMEPAIDRDATPQDLLDAFGFRGVEWGNWSAQDERQRILNMAYDALSDLAKIMNVPRKALSLNGTLGMAFGARGGGRFAAHYEPGKLVINMTKLRGAGSLAHEWAHALDHYLGEIERSDAYQGKARGASGWYGQRSYTGRDAPANLRPELASAIDRVMRRLFEGTIDKPTMLAELQAQLERTQALAARETDPKLKAVYTDSLAQQQRRIAEVKAAPDDTTYHRGKSDYAQQAQKLSGKSVDGYWLRPTEMWARAFESYVFDRLVAMGAKSEYLVHGVEQDRFDDASRFKGNPYPKGDERAAINKAFDAFVSELKTREDGEGRVALFSRAAPFIEVARDADNGMPTYANAQAGIVLAAPQVTERMEVIEGEGEQVVNYAIMPADGFDVLGFVEVLMKDGKPVSLLDIETNDRRAGVGRKVIETLLAANPGEDLNISNIVPAARGFWAKMGIPEQNVEGAYDGTLNWQAYQEAQDRRGADSDAQAGRAARGEPDAGAARADRSPAEESPQGLSRAEAEAVLALPQATINRLLGRRPSLQRLRQVVGAIQNDVDVAVVQSVDDLPPEQRKKLSAIEPSGNVRGVYFPDIDRIWLIADHLHSEAEASFVLLHEAFHRGLAKTFGADARRVLRQMYHTNGKLQKLTKEQMQAHGIGQDEAIEEALADLAGRGEARDLKGWQRLVDIIRRWLGEVGRALGFELRWTDDMIQDFVAGTARAGLQRGVHVSMDPVARASKVLPLREAHNFAEARAAAKDFQGRQLVNAATGMKATVSRNALDKMLSQSAVSKTGDAAIQALAVANVDHLFENAVLGWSKPDELGNTNLQAVHRFFSVLPTTEGLRLAKLTVKEHALQGNRIYTVEAVELNEESPAAIWVDATVRADGLDPTSIRSAGDVLSLAEHVERSNRSRRGASGDADPKASRASDAAQWISAQQLPLGYQVGDLLKSSGKLSWWHKTVGTMHNLAERSPAFKRVYDAAQQFLNDVSLYATEAADLAPTLLPKLESLRDITKSPLSAEDTKAIGAPIFEGTLRWTRDDTGEVVPATDVGTAGVRWTDDELRSRFKLNDKQVGLYHEFRAAADKSLQDLAVSDMIRFGGSDVEAVRAAALAAPNPQAAAKVLTDHLAELAAAGGKDRAATLSDTGAKILEKAQRAQDLIARGYAPLSRFGHYTLDVTEGGERVYFGLFESEAEANRMARQMRKQYPGAQVAQGTMSDEEYRMFSGVSPETAELFGEMLGLETQGNDPASKAFQEYLKLAKSNRSAMKRLIERKGIEGFSEDAGRVLAVFVYSNARQTSKNLHLGELGRAVQSIAEDKGQGELLDAAVKLHQYVTNPQEEAQGLKGLMFAQFLGGSVAAGLVNMTQPFMVTFPYLSQWGGVASAAARMSNAVRDAVKKTTGDAALDAALKKAEEEGVVSPQEVHSLIAQARGAGALKAGDGTLAGDAAAKASNFMSKLTLAWGRPFALAEQFNRRVTFIAAYRTAVAEGMADPAAFAKRAIDETQFNYTKANRPAWARGAVGGALFTFKQYSISYVELLSRMAQSGPEGRKAALLGLAMLMLASGVEGLPGAGDLDDLIDGLLQRLGYNFSSKQARREFLAGIVGDGGAQFLTKGVSGIPGVPIDVAGRLGLGNLVPGTGLLLKKSDHGSDVAELAGPAGAIAKRAFGAAGQLAEGNLREAATSVLPVAAANLVKAYDMASMGMYRDSRGRKVLDTDGYDAFVKAIGFQPTDVARVQQAAGDVQRTVDLVKMRETEIADRWARAMFERDSDGIADARKELADWNAANPEARISITSAQLVKRIKEMNATRAERVAKTAPKEIRASVRRELEVSP